MARRHASADTVCHWWKCRCGDERAANVSFCSEGCLKRETKSDFTVNTVPRCLSEKKNDTFVIHSGWEGVIKSMQQDFTVDNSSKNIEANKLLQETALFCLLPQAQLI